MLLWCLLCKQVIVQRDIGINTDDRVSVKWCEEQMMRCGTVVALSVAKKVIGLLCC